jgi:hypothetical protein
VRGVILSAKEASSPLTPIYESVAQASRLCMIQGDSIYGGQCPPYIIAERSGGNGYLLGYPVARMAGGKAVRVWQAAGGVPAIAVLLTPDFFPLLDFFSGPFS